MPQVTSAVFPASRTRSDLRSRTGRGAESANDSALSDLQVEVIRLSPADQELIAQALLAPPKPSPALRRAFALRDKLLRTE